MGTGKISAHIIAYNEECKIAQADATAACTCLRAFSPETQHFHTGSMRHETSRVHERFAALTFA